MFQILQRSCVTMSIMMKRMKNVDDPTMDEEENEAFACVIKY